MPIRTIRDFVKLEAAGGIILCIFAVLGLMIANSPLTSLYHFLLYQPITGTVSTNLIINDGLMAIFFLVVGLEIKREIVVGELNSTRKIALPAIAAAMGMLAPAVIYLITISPHKNLLPGWAIPTATDIAFALTVLTLLGKRIPLSIKILLTAIAIFDDVGAIIIIAIFYTHQIMLGYLFAAALIFASLCVMNYLKVNKLWPFLALGLLLWFCILQSGIHATIAGVLFAFTIPMSMQNLEQQLHPWVAFFILPLFALANTGIPLHVFQPALLLSALPLGIALGLFLGKQFGIFLALFAAIKSGIAELPTGSNWKMLYGVALICGIGFTMSLFIGGLAFTDPATLDLVRVGVLTGSLLSGGLGYLLLRFS